MPERKLKIQVFTLLTITDLRKLVYSALDSPHRQGILVCSISESEKQQPGLVIFQDLSVYFSLRLRREDTQHCVRNLGVQTRFLKTNMMPVCRLFSTAGWYFSSLKQASYVRTDRTPFRMSKIIVPAIISLNFHRSSSKPTHMQILCLDTSCKTHCNNIKNAPASLPLKN